MPVKKLCHCGRYATSGAYCPQHFLEEKERTKIRQSNNFNRKKRNQIYGTSEWRKVAKATKERDNWTCSKCNWVSPDGKGLVADHINPILETDDPFNLENLQTLCLICSGRKDGQRGNSTNNMKTQTEKAKPNQWFV